MRVRRSSFFEADEREETSYYHRSRNDEVPPAIERGYPSGWVCVREWSAGGIFVRNAPSGSVGDLAQALKNIFSSDSEIKIIGVRHGEKMHETLASKEELLRSEDMGDYLRLGMDDRDLNYNKYFIEGDKKVVQTEDYTSQNTTRLTLKEIEEMLLEQPEIISELNQIK